jgi:putative membrane protein
MSSRPYARFAKEKLILRDLLAADRTSLANERTFLAYVRTALTLFVAGVTFIKFFNNRLVEIIGWVFAPAGVAALVLGAIRFQQMRNRLDLEKRETFHGRRDTVDWQI